MQMLPSKAQPQAQLTEPKLPQLQALPTPRQIVAHLDQSVQGQTEAKKALALAIHQHYLGLAYNEHLKENNDEYPEKLPFGSQHLLLIGPSGSGKSYLVQLIAQFLQVPYTFVAATSLVQTGYVGTHTQDMIQSLYLRSGQDAAQTERGIIFIDEIDKVRVHRGESLDVNGEGVQNALLTVLDGRPITISQTSDSHSLKIEINTTGILFICAGAFAAGLSDLIRDRLSQSHRTSLGFIFPENNTEKAKVKDLDDAEWLKQVETEDLVKFGFIPEFIGRFSHLSVLDALTVDHLVEILLKTQDSVLSQKQALFALHGIELNFTRPALKAIAEKALALKTGARALTRILKDCLKEIEYQLPELAQEGVSEITFNKTSVMGGQPQLTYSQESPNSLTQIEQLHRHFTAFQTSVNPQPEVVISQTQEWSQEKIVVRLEQVKSQIGWGETTGSAKKWWEAFEKENQHRLSLVLKLAEELLVRKGTITEFFLAYVYSNTDNIQANLHYLDYTRLKKEEEKRKKEQAQKSGITTSPNNYQGDSYAKADRLGAVAHGGNPQDRAAPQNGDDSIEVIHYSQVSSGLKSSEKNLDFLPIKGEGDYNLFLTEVKPEKKIPVLKAVRYITQLGLKEAKDLVESPLPILVLQGFSQGTLLSFQKQIEEAGGKTEVKRKS
jgi:ATP-dependent Clp protease ATP-binding subunit ClpX